MTVVHIEYDELERRLRDAYRHGVSQAEMAAAGLETTDPEGYARWEMKKIVKECKTVSKI